MTQGLQNLVKWYGRVTEADRAEGLLAYPEYNRIMADLSRLYRIAPERVCAIFVSLSPNSEYHQNLRSAVTVLEAIVENRPVEQVNVSTYRHCLERAWAYGTGERDFERETAGLKVLSFYRNILDPYDPEFVTIDGHMKAMWVNKRLTMKEAVVKGKTEYYEIRDTVIAMATLLNVSPSALQAMLWFTRKRYFGIYDVGSLDVHAPIDVNHIRPFAMRLKEPRISEITQIEISF